VPNPHKGETSIAIGDKTYTLRLGFDCLATIEEKTGAPIEQTFRDLSDNAKPRLRLMRLVFWAALLEHHPDLTEKQAGDLIIEAGLGNVMTAFGQVSAASFPSADGQAAADGDAAIPQSAGDGTGLDSSAKQ
jgi:hypothetical protein